MSTTDALTTRATVRSLVAAFSAAEATIRASFAALRGAEATLNSAFSLQEGDAGWMRVDASRYGYHDNFNAADMAVERMARKAWARVVERLELRRVMSIERWDALQAQLRDGVLPPFTAEAVEALARDLPPIHEMHAEAVREVYEWLRPRVGSHTASYKTNQRNARFELGETIILTGMIEKSWQRKGMFGVRQDGHRLQALERVFLALDGAGMTGRGHYSELEVAIKATTDGGRGRTDLFAFRACANGNLHLRFARPDLLAAFNRVAGGRRLRSAPEGEAA